MWRQQRDQWLPGVLRVEGRGVDRRGFFSFRPNPQNVRYSLYLSEPQGEPCALVMVMCTFILGNKRAILVSEMGDGGSHTCVGAGSIWELSGPSCRFWCKSKTALNKNLQNKRNRISAIRVLGWTFLAKVLFQLYVFIHIVCECVFTRSWGKIFFRSEEFASHCSKL